MSDVPAISQFFSSPGYFASLTFGRETAQFRELITFLTILSLALWACVVFTLLLRVVARYAWHRRHHYETVKNDPPTT